MPYGCSDGTSLYGYNSSCCNLDPLPVGSYTLVAEDLWNDTVYAYFQVVAISQTNISSVTIILAGIALFMATIIVDLKTHRIRKLWHPIVPRPTGMKSCTGCDARITAVSRFCEKCGAEQPIFCSNCGRRPSVGSRFCGYCGGALETPSSGLKQPDVRMNAPRNQATLEDASTSLLVGVGLLLLSICLFFGFFSGMLNVDEGTFGFLFMLMVLAFFSSAPLIYYGMRHFGYDSGASVFLMYLVLFILGFIILFFGMVLSAGP